MAAKLTPEEQALLLRFQDAPEEWVDVQDIRTDGQNPNQMSKEKYLALLEHIREFGIINPILTTTALLVADGEHRLKAARDLKIPQVKVKRLDITEEERRILRQTMNKLRGTHDPLLDAAEFNFLLEADRMQDLGRLLGEDPADLLRVLDQKEGTKPDDDEFDPDAVLESIDEPTTRPGDVWRLGTHTLVCGDATDPETWLALLQAAGTTQAEMMLTDPPYNVDYGGTSSTDESRRRAKDLPPKFSARTILNDKMGKTEFQAFLQAFFENAMQHVRGAQYVFMSSQEWPRIHQAFEEAGGHWSSTIVWVKDSFVISRKDYHPQHEPIFKGRRGKTKKTKGEPILYGWKEGTPHYTAGSRTETDVWVTERPTRSPLHPMMKPLPLLRKAILNSSKPTQVVAEPFAGSGSTLIACEQTKRRCVAMELDPKYCDVIRIRWERFTGKVGERLTTGPEPSESDAPEEAPAA